MEIRSWQYCQFCEFVKNSNLSRISELCELSTLPPKIKFTHTVKTVSLFVRGDEKKETSCSHFCSSKISFDFIVVTKKQYRKKDITFWNEMSRGNEEPFGASCTARNELKTFKASLFSSEKHLLFDSLP